VVAGLNISRERCFSANSKATQRAVNLMDLILRSLGTEASLWLDTNIFGGRI